MEESDNIASHKDGSGDEKQDQRDDEQPTTSRADTYPIQISHNMNDMKAIDFNSADEIRQAMKAVLAGKLPPQSFSEEASRLPVHQPQQNPDPVQIKELVQNHQQTIPGAKAQKHNQVRPTSFIPKLAPTNGWNYKQATFGTLTRRRGRPPKAGPSRKLKKGRLSSMYLGKLSNVVPFRRRWESESESEVESVVIFY